MERRTYERMTREIQAIHRALTGDELRVDEARDAQREAPSEGELAARFAELTLAARSIPSVAFELWALELDAETKRGATTRDESRAISEDASRADAEE